MASQEQFQISNAPSKFDLMVSLMDNATGGMLHRRLVDFTVQDGTSTLTLKVFINGLEREDGSGENWNFKGHAVSTSISIGIAASAKLQQLKEKVGRNQSAIHGYYNTQRRRGWLESTSD